MKILILKCDLITSQLTVENANNLEVGNNDLGFSFVSNTPHTLIKHIRFGLEIYTEEKCVLNINFPKNMANYLIVDCNPFEIIQFEIKINTNYQIKHWVEMPGKLRIENSFNIGAMYPKKPFPSWVWNGEEWEAPIVKKFDKPTRWNEEKKIWEDDPETPVNMFPGYEVE
jgi:hypothetical protein